ncbi:hypothetical protein Pelo_10282 [Pelomyxa schiedti]|nr:hypothetical protein Pelo_10282 [Pelomyxa schiedti]
MFTTTSSVVARFVRGAHKFYFFARNTGQSRGYAFVDFEDRRDAEDAFERYNGYEISGRRLRLDWDVGLPKKMQVYTRQRRQTGDSRSRSRSPRYRYRSRSRSSRSPSKSRSRSPRSHSRGRHHKSSHSRSHSPKKNHSSTPVKTDPQPTHDAPANNP